VLEFVKTLQDEGNVKVASVKQKRGKHAKAESSDSDASALDISQNAFCGSNVMEVVKLLKSAIEPLNQLIAETEAELAKDSQLADSSRPRQKCEMLALKLNTQYVKSLDALLAVKRTVHQADVKNGTDSASLPIISVERLDESATKAEDLSSSRAANSVNNSNRASRADIEAQRDLHKQMLSAKDESSESGDNSSESSTSSSEDADSSSSEEADDDDEYDPKHEIRQVKLERGHERRTTMKKQKMRAGK